MPWQELTNLDLGVDPGQSTLGLILGCFLLELRKRLNIYYKGRWSLLGVARPEHVAADQAVEAVMEPGGSKETRQLEPDAVKVLNMIDHKASKSFMAELRSDDERYITENLNLSRGLDTAIDVASTLEYLHNQCEISIIHCDLKPSNILHDEDMVAHVGDFGLAKFLQRNKNNDSGTTNSTSSFSPRGTVGYIPPEYGIGVKPSTRDMYSYGVLLLEMFAGK
ncbi:hypothetical protein Syun_030971 [Stephania yunnanensis]|uniref:Protein kinase domain-containing protein n=1 Tax=Stephania yunnanensis TaxID=152371 RepID=A0AAP0HCP3_9MAGN